MNHDVTGQNDRMDTQSVVGSECSLLQNMMNQTRTTQEFDVLTYGGTTVCTHASEAMSMISHVTHLAVPPMVVEFKNNEMKFNEDVPNENQRHTVVIGAKCDIDDIHKYQLTVDKFEEKPHAPQWCHDESVNVNYLLAFNADILWYHKQFSMIPSDILKNNRNIQFLRRWKTAGDDKQLETHDGLFSTHAHYLNFIANSDMPYIQVENGLIKTKLMNFVKMRQQMMKFAVNSVSTYFPDLPTVQRSKYKCLINEIVWQSTVTIDRLIEEFVGDKPNVNMRKDLSDNRKLRKQQSFWERMIACHYTFFDLQQVW